MSFPALGRPERRTAFTLVELLVVIAIIGVLIALLLPAVQQAREAARRMSCSNNLKQLGLALHNYHDTHRSFPYGSRGASNPVSWHVAILPFIEQGNLFDQMDMTVNFESGVNAPFRSTRMDAFLCPSGAQDKADDNSAHYTTHYYGVMGPTGTNATTSSAYQENTSGAHGGFSKEGIWSHDEVRKMRDMLDGTSNTFAFGEISWTERNGKATRYRPWSRGGRTNEFMAPCKNIAQPINADYTALFNDMSYGSNHPGGCLFSLGDASVRFVAETVNYDTLLSMGSCAGGESTTLD
ncbi:DUF1559 domain-containing protein [Blastopirellula marina]|uniref:DUF1559 domain-containing protein n=1 Tax=Blastopirellula marina DSM 3645 TaxID=314230 RepID=A3ZM51_9BACT|nr:DUF1559 domain-containing protein [Blastopirellula marina]EAQ82834.1 hypothetical protein DSM3645_10552 [Blastopirellula marina DSM 3645]